MDHDFSLIFSYFGRFNLTGFPAGVVPATRVRASEAHLPLDGDRFERRAAAVAARSAGLPVAVQVVGRPWHESVVLAVLVAIEEAAHARGEAPRVPVDPFVLQG
jgi:fatty acid amide hydrolase